MKLRTVNIIEIILAALWLIGYILTKAHIPYMAIVALLSAFILGILYYPLGFYTLKLPGIHTANAIVYGILFSVTVVATMFDLQKWPLAHLYCMTGIYGFLLLVLIRLIAVYLFHKKQVLAFNKGIAVRWLILFAAMLYSLVNYQFM